MRRMILAVALLAVPASAGGQSRAEDPCAAAQPDNRQKVDGRKSTSAHVSGLLTSVSGDGCDMLLTDVTVPAGYRVMLEGGVEGGTAPGHACEQWRLITRWFQKRGGTGPGSAGGGDRLDRRAGIRPGLRRRRREGRGPGGAGGRSPAGCAGCLRAAYEGGDGTPLGRHT